MIGFEEYRLDTWQSDGFTIHVPFAFDKSKKTLKRAGASLQVVLRASVLSLGLCVSSLAVGEAGLTASAVPVVKRDFEKIATLESNVPDGYWERLLVKLKTAKQLPTDSLVDDPDPLG